MKKKVLIVTSPLRVGGFDVVATSLQMHLDRERFECTYYIVGDEVGPLEPKVIESGAKVIHRPSNVRGYLADYKYLKKVIREGKYDAVHSHLMFFSGLVMLAARSEGVPVRVPHGHMTDPCIEDRSFLQRRMFDVYRFFMTLLLDSCGTALVACGPESGAYLYGKRTFEKRGIILNNGIDLSKYKFDSEMRERKRRELGVENKLVVGHVGRLNYIKNHKFLLDVFAELKKINADAVLLIVGEGEEKEYVEAHQSEYIIPVGRLAFEEVVALLESSDIFCLPSLSEGFATSALEAAACHCYIITTERGGTKELVMGKEYGTVMKDNHVDTLYRALEDVANDPEKRRKAQELCYERLRKHFTWECTTDELERIVNE